MSKIKESVGEYISRNYDNQYLYKIWSDKNVCDPYEMKWKGVDRIWLKCQNDPTHHDYDLTLSNFKVSHNCPYCAGKRVCKSNSLGKKFPETLLIWSDINEKTPYEYTPGSSTEVWWKCPIEKHDEYKRMISRSVTYEFRCPECGRENQYNPSGPNHPNWKGDAIEENRRIRWSPEYKRWRKMCFEMDDYVCQCCGIRGGDLNIYHLKDFATHEDLRFDENNAITLCASCHDVTIPGSFHNLYGTHGKTEQELEEYINNKRKQLGINIPFSIDEYKQGKILKPNDINISLGMWIFDSYSPSELKSNFKKIKVA